MCYVTTINLPGIYDEADIYTFYIIKEKSMKLKLMVHVHNVTGEFINSLYVK